MILLPLSLVRWTALFAIFLIAACAHSTSVNRQIGAEASPWQGRISIKVHTDPPQVFAAHFELLGDANSGTLVFTTPLGTTLAHLQWSPQSASLQSAGPAQTFDSLSALTLHATGSELPVASLFAWLHGIESAPPGWEVNLHELPQGRLYARRQDAASRTELAILLDR